MEATSERTRNLRIHLFALSSSRSLLVSFPGYWILSVAANAVFSVTTMALDLSYIIPIFCRRIHHSHPDVMFKNMAHSTWVMDGWVCCAILFAYHGHSLFALSSQYQLIFQ
jgi:hypothetical protein